MVWIWWLSRVHLQWSALVLSAKGKELKLSGKTSYREEKILLKLMRLFRTPLEVNIQLYHHIHSNSSNTWARGSHQPKPLQRCFAGWGKERVVRMERQWSRSCCMWVARYLFWVQLIWSAPGCLLWCSTAICERRVFLAYSCALCLFSLLLEII